jgi:hypothetical protein
MHNLDDFARLILLDAHFVRFHVRLSPTASYFANDKTREIRTKAHDALAFGIDVLGNVTVLWADGRRQQLISDAEIKASGLFR